MVMTTLRFFVGGMIFTLMSVVCSGQSIINVSTPGTLSKLVLSQEKDFTVTGTINGTDAKYLRQQAMEGRITSLNLADVRIVAGGEAYNESYTTEDDVVPQYWMKDCSALTHVVLPLSATQVGDRAFASSGLKGKLVIPDNIRRLGLDAFAYCNNIDTVVIGSRVSKLDQGVFYSSNVKHAYVKSLNPASTPSWFFSSRPTFHVYSEVLDDYKESSWASYGSFVGGLEDLFPLDNDAMTIVNGLIDQFFEDSACTILKSEFAAMDDEDLRTAFTESGMPDFMSDIALRLKNNRWKTYEKDFRIHGYQAYSDANYWNDKLWTRSGSYMGNPTGIYTAKDGDPLYVFVDTDVPEDATLYIAGMDVDKMITNAKTGQKLKRGLNIIDGGANLYYYILYTADTRTMTKRLTEWPLIKIHIEGGVADGYYDASCHTDADYKQLLKAATYSTFVVKGLHSVMNIRTSIFRQTYPNAIHKSSACLDSLSVWENDLMGICESVANGEKVGEPYCLSGGDGFYPGYFNNPSYVDNDSPGSLAHATEYGIHLSTGAIRTFINPYISDYDEGGTAHELGHQRQSPIMLEGTTEGSNDLFANVCRLLMGHRASTGRPLSVTMDEFGHGVPFYWRGADNGFLRMYYSLYLYYHQAQKNTSFYPNLFKALREDRIVPYGSNTLNSGLKFVRKVCEVAQEDLTDFFTAYGFFEPTSRRYLECYGDHWVTTRLQDVTATKAAIAQYPVKNREILFVEDRVDYIPTNDMVTTPGQHRYYRDGEQVGQCGDVGQYTSFLPDAEVEPSDYTYYQSDSLYALHGQGGIGFIMLNADGQMRYASNAKTFCIPSGVKRDFTIYSVDIDGTLREVPKAGYGTEYVTLTKAGHLADSLSDYVVKAVVSGVVNSTDIKTMRQLTTEGTLISLDLTGAKMVIGGTAYYGNYKAQANAIGQYAFYNCDKLSSIQLPQSVNKIDGNAFAHTGLQEAYIPDGVASLGGDAFAYCNKLRQVIIGSGMKTIKQGAFYSSEQVEHAYVKALTPPSVEDYLFSSKPIIHVYKSALSAYQSSRWAEFGTIVGDLDQYDDIISGIREIRNEELDNNSQLSILNPQLTYDLYGRPVASPQPGHIYIRGGKKFIAR